jgi:hypothetical protein
VTTWKGTPNQKRPGRAGGQIVHALWQRSQNGLPAVTTESELVTDTDDRNCLRIGAVVAVRTDRSLRVLRRAIRINYFISLY